MGITFRRHLLVLASCMVAFAFALKAQTLASAHPPRYPLAAKAAGIDGPVVLKGTITIQGKIKNLHVLSGPPELHQAAMDAVSDWTYQPYMDRGRPVEVETTVTVNFDMGRGKKKAAAQAKAQAEMAKASPQSPTQETSPSTTPPQ